MDWRRASADASPAREGRMASWARAMVAAQSSGTRIAQAIFPAKNARDFGVICRLMWVSLRLRLADVIPKLFPFAMGVLHVCGVLG